MVPIPRPLQQYQLIEESLVQLVITALKVPLSLPLAQLVLTILICLERALKTVFYVKSIPIMMKKDSKDASLAETLLIQHKEP